MIRIVVADDHEVLRWGLVQALVQQPDMVVVAEAATSEEAVEVCAQFLPDVLVLDLSLPRRGGWWVLEQVLESRPGARVVILSADDDALTVHTAIVSGAWAHVSKAEAASGLVAVLRSAAALGSEGDVAASASSDRAGGPQAPGRRGGGTAGTG
ncbi:response regulator [Knoellia sp. CPCC 206435]|uniref:response regulator n=1 Tax=Knoellia terrae TaxID=3404797 RepID=UPI003B432C8E